MAHDQPPAQRLKRLFKLGNIVPDELHAVVAPGRELVEDFGVKTKPQNAG